MTLTLVPDPKGLQWQDWVDTVVGYNADLRNQVAPETDWRFFADFVTRAVPEAPRHDMFDTWDAWARALKFTVNV